ncbi:DUF397 domain-containing protein [Streptomyces albus]
MSASCGRRADARLVWAKSSYSSNDSPDCVEMADAAGTVHVRDSKNVTGPRLAFAADTWADFVSFVTR